MSDGNQKADEIVGFKCVERAHAETELVIITAHLANAILQFPVT